MISRIAIFLATGLLAVAAFSADRAPPPIFENPQRIESSEGHTTLSWTLPEDRPGVYHYELVSAASARFAQVEPRYKGPDLATFVSGLEEGETWFRVRAIGESGTAGPWSEPVSVAVDYASAAEVWRLLGLGMVVLIATVATILTGHRRRATESA